MSSATTCRPSRVSRKNASPSLQEWANRIATWGGRPAINGFPFSFKESGETPQCLAHVHRDILSFAGSLPPKCRHRDASCGQTDSGHRPEADRAWENRILSVETEFPARIRGRHADIREDFIHALMQIEIGRRCRMTQLLFQCFS